jgi:hypothetical protein
MPEISRFFGILIRMYFDDHNPPHFHAIYAGNEAEIAIEPIEILEGKLPARAASMVFEWAALHQRELLRTGTACTTSSLLRELGLWNRSRLCFHE